MLEFILSCLILFGILIWWTEARFNYLYEIIQTMKSACDWLKEQTKLKIDICKCAIPFILIVGVCAVLWNTLYLPYFKDTTNFKNGVLSIKDNSKTDILDKDKTNPIGDWGTFGDFIGGTLNPILGLISVLLLFGTWRLTSKTLDITKQELSVQQFDTIFWGLLDYLKKTENQLYNLIEDETVLDEIYNNIFISKKYESLFSCREKILMNSMLSQYFVVLYQLLKKIDNGLNGKDFKLKKSYSNIVRANIPVKILQLLAINCYKEFPEYKLYLEKFSFLEHMPFYNLNNPRLFNLLLIECLAVYSLDVLDKSVYLEKYQRESIYKDFLNGKFKGKSNFLDIWLGSFKRKGIIKISDYSKKSNINQYEIEYVIKKNGEIYVSSVSGLDIYINGFPLVLGEKNSVVTSITDRGFEFNLLNQWVVVINPLESESIKIIKNPT